MFTEFPIFLTKQQSLFNDRNYCKKWIPDAQLGECGNARRNSRVMSVRLEKKMPPICRTYRTVAPSLLTRFNWVFKMLLHSFRNKSHACEIMKSKIINLVNRRVFNDNFWSNEKVSWYLVSRSDYWQHCNDIYILEISKIN